MKTKIKALPTIYRGKEYRSSTEARWHAYFDLIGLEVHHEHEAYNINGRNYLPDFKTVRQYNGASSGIYEKCPWFIEVKGSVDEALDNYALMKDFSEETQSFVSIVWGHPSMNYFPVFIKGELFHLSASYTWYGFTRKGWSEPFWDNGGDFYIPDNREDLASVELVRCAKRNRNGELIIESVDHYNKYFSKFH